MMLGHAAYSVRLLSPFRGMLQIVESDGARALSMDGVAWQLQVLCAHRRHPWRGRDDGEKEIMRYAVCGAWTAKHGLRRFPLDPTVDVQAVRAKAEELVRSMPLLGSGVPFARRDNVELWLLDGAMRAPLALVASAVEGSDPPAARTVQWKPVGGSGRAYPMASTRGVNGTQVEVRQQCELLAERVRQLAGVPPQARWFRRTADGGGESVDQDQHGRVEGRRLPAEAFPELLLRDLWDDDADQRRAERFFEWQAPLLLTLPDLSIAARDRLEYAARRQAVTVHAVHRLYPSVVNRDLINAALVEASLRAAAS
jgi:hypothetical protein